MLKFFPDAAPPNPSDNLKALKVRDLLTMSSGQAVEHKAGPRGPSVKQFLAQPLPYPPGTHFLYNTMGTYVLSAIVTKVTGQTVLDYLKPRLLDPLGRIPRWDSSTEGYSLGGYSLYLRTEDLAKFSQLILQHGKWKGKQLVLLKRVEEATSRHMQPWIRPTPRSVLTGTRAMDFSSGAAAMMRSEPTAQAANLS